MNGYIWVFILGMIELLNNKAAAIAIGMINDIGSIGNIFIHNELLLLSL